MAASGYTPISIYHSTTASAVPVNTNLVNGELAINIADGKLYYKDSGGTVQVIATKATGTIGGSDTQVQYNSSGALAGSSNFTFNGTTATINTLNLTNALGATYGGTAQSSWTTGDLLYASGSNTLAKLGIGLNTYILTSNGSIPGWAAPSAISVNTATNLAGGAAGSVPYQSGAGATTFLSIGTANQVVTSTGSAPQWSSGLSITTLTASDAVTFSATTQNIALGTSQTSGTFTVGGTAQTGNISIDRSTKTHTLNIGTGITESGQTKTINIGTAGDTGSTTAITIGSANGTTITVNGTVNASTLDLTNLEVTNIKAKDGTAAMSIADGTGIVTFSKATVIETTDNTNAALRITQLGTGNALLVEDAANPDSTPFVVTAAGDVGIGTSNPLYKLHVTGSVYASAVQIGEVSAFLSNSPDALIGWAASFSGYTNGTLILQSRSSAATPIVFATGSTSATERAQIDSSGTLILRQSSNAANTSVSFNTTVQNALTLDSSGRLGIGTPTPSQPLSVAAAAALVDITSTTGTNFNGVELKNTSGSFYVGQDNSAGSFYGSNSAYARSLYSTGAYPMVFFTNSTEKMRLDSSGNLGLGVPPSAWVNVVKVLQIGAVGGTVIGGNTSAGGTSFFGQNYYYDTSYKFETANAATYYAQTAGQHQWWRSTATPVIGNDPVFTQAMTLDASGNLAVGDTSSSRRLKAKFDSNTVYSASSMETTSLLTYITNGSTTVGAYSGIHFNTGGDGDAAIAGVRTAAGDMALTFGTRGTGSGNIIERARITSLGYFKASNTGSYVGLTGGYHELVNGISDYIVQTRNSHSSSPYGIRIQYSGSAPNGTGNEFLYCDDNASGGTLRAAIRSNGGLANYSANNVNLASDERLKKDISPLATTWDKLKQIEVVNFRYKDCNEGDPLLYGVIAQQVQPIVPELVVVTREAKEAVEAKDAVLDESGKVIEPAVEAKEATPDYYGIREQPMYWLAIKALQEAMARIEKLEAEVAALKGA